MSAMLSTEPIGSIPEETVRVAQAAFPKGNLYMQMRDTIGVIYSDEDVATLFSHTGQPAVTPWRLMLVTVMQYVENLTDRQAADAVRGRIDWKYALGLALTDAGFDFSVLSEFRTRLVNGGAEAYGLDRMLTGFAEQGWLKRRRCQRTDSTHVVATVRDLNRLELVGEALHAALNSLAVAAPAWLKAWVPEEWYARYGQPCTEYRLPKNRTERHALAHQIGTDGVQLLQMVNHADAPCWLRQITAVETLRQIWVQQYYLQGDAIPWRTKDRLPPSDIKLASPYDLDARYSRKRAMTWIGYKVHFTETCDPDAPNLIPQVETTLATEQDVEALPRIQHDLAQHDRRPHEQLLDWGYGSSDIMIQAEDDYGITMICPVQPDQSWQARAGQGFDKRPFRVDWTTRTVTCPMGHTNRFWIPTLNPRGQPVIRVKFDQSDCLACAERARCTRHTSRAGRGVTLLADERQERTLQHARQVQQSEAFQQTYKLRAGVEGTFSQATRVFGLRYTRYRGLAKTHLQHLWTAAAMNLVRAFAWFSGVPRATTPVARFAALAA